MAKFRHKMSSHGSKRHFSKHAAVTHKKNTPGARAVMRGGIRL